MSEQILITHADMNAANEIEGEWDLNNGALGPVQERIAAIVAQAMHQERQALRKALDVLERHRSPYLSVSVPLETLVTHTNKLIVDTNAAIAEIKAALTETPKEVA